MYASARPLHEGEMEVFAAMAEEGRLMEADAPAGGAQGKKLRRATVQG